jgi:AcrR family transcriptional regulator
MRSCPVWPQDYAAGVTQPKHRRVSHGERTRMEILDVAEGLATREGLASLSIARLAEEVGMSKGGVFAHFGSKEALQLATVDAARARFVREVFEPALRAPPGAAQVRAAFELYFTYIASRLDAGGCFFTATTLEMADRPGAVRDQVAAFLAARHALIIHALQDAVKRKDLRAGVDPEQLAFELGSVATGAMVELQMFKDPKTIERARVALARRLKEVFKSRVLRAGASV